MIAKSPAAIALVLAAGLAGGCEDVCGKMWTKADRCARQLGVTDRDRKALKKRLMRRCKRRAKEMKPCLAKVDCNAFARCVGKRPKVPR